MQSRLDIAVSSRDWTCCVFVQKPLGSLINILIALSLPIQLVIPHMVCLVTLDMAEANLSGDSFIQARLTLR